MIKKVGQLVDYISAHHYSVGWGPFQKDDYMGSLYIPNYMERLTNLTLTTVTAGMNDTEHHIKVAWDEWNLFGWVFDGVDDDNTYTLHDALITALILNMFINNSDKIGMANYSTFVNINGAISTYENEIVKRPQYYVFDLLGKHMGNVVLDTSVSGEKLTVNISQSEKIGQKELGINLSRPREKVYPKAVIQTVDCVATQSDDGKVFLSLINKHPTKDVQVLIDVNGMDRIKIIGHYTIYHDDVFMSNTRENPNRVVIQEEKLPISENQAISLVLKKHSISLIELTQL